MDGTKKTKEQLIKEVETLRARLSSLEQVEAVGRQAQQYLDIAGVMIVAIDADQTVSLANRKCCQILGYEEEEIIGRNWFDTFLPERDRELVKETFNRLMVGEVEPVAYFENPVLTREGEERIIAWHNTVRTDDAGDIVGTMSSGEDITERKQAEEQLRMLSLAIEQNTDSISILDPTGIVEYMNPKALELARSTLEELIGKHWAVSLSEHTSLREDLQEIRDTVLGRGMPWSGEVTDRAGDGSMVWRRATITPIKNAEGELIHTVYTSQDITGRRHAEEALRRRDTILEAVNSMAERFLRTPEWRQVIDEILKKLGEATEVDRVAIFERHPSEDGILLASLSHEWVADGVTPSINDPRLQSFDVAKAGYESQVDLWNQGQVTLSQSRPGEPTAVQRLWGTMSAVNVPIFVQDELWGVIVFNMVRMEREWSTAEIEALQIAANMLGTAIERHQAEEALQRHTERLGLLREIDRAILAAQSPDEIAQAALNHIRQLVPCVRASVAIFDFEVEEATVLAADVNGETQLAVGARIPLEEFGIGEALLRGESHVVRDVREYPRLSPVGRRLLAEGIHSYVNVPLFAQGELIGSLNLGADTPDTYTADHIEIAREVADQLAIAIKQAHLYEQVQRHAEELEQRVSERTAELQQEKDRVEAILRSTADGIITTDPSGTVLSINPALEAQTGYRADEIVGHRLEGAIPGSTTMSGQTLDEIRETVLVGKPWQGEIEVRRRDGTTFDAGLSIAPLQGEGEEIGGLVIGVRDISPQKELERLKDEFVSNVSHELRSPLANIKLYLRLLEMNPQKHEAYMDTLLREMSRLERLVEDLLYLSRLDQQVVQFNPVAVNLNALADVYVTDRASLAKSKGLTLKADKLANLPAVQADPVRLGQALSALLTNAFNYTPPGGEVVIFTRDQRVEGRSWAGIGVRDTGPGIPPQEQALLFERFFRGRVGRESGAGGTGLGLAIANEIVRRHQGRFEVESEGIPGEGATFTVWLPVDAEDFFRE